MMITAAILFAGSLLFCLLAKDEVSRDENIDLYGLSRLWPQIEERSSGILSYSS